VSGFEKRGGLGGRGSGIMVCGLWFTVWDFGVKVQVVGWRVQGLGFSVGYQRIRFRDGRRV